MPTEYVKKVAKEKGLSVKEAESIWDKAKAAASKTLNKNDDNYWATVTTIFKNMTGTTSAIKVLAAYTTQDVKGLLDIIKQHLSGKQVLKTCDPENQSCHKNTIDYLTGDPDLGAELVMVGIKFGSKLMVTHSFVWSPRTKKILSYSRGHNPYGKDSYFDYQNSEFVKANGERVPVIYRESVKNILN